MIREDSPNNQLPQIRNQTSQQQAAGPSRLEKGKRTLFVEAVEEAEAAPPAHPLAKELEKMNRKIEELARERGKPQETDEVTRHPFTDEIMQEPLPLNFQQSSESYDGKTDPLDHLLNYNCAMTLQGITDAIMCRAFPGTLKGVARTWYSSLPARSIESFSQFSKAFAYHFSSSLRQHRSSASLMAIRQLENEPLRQYLDRFKAAVVEVADLDQALAMAAVMRGLRHEKLVYALHKKMPRNLTDLMEKAEKFIRADEALAARRKEANPSSESPQKRREPEVPRRDQRVEFTRKQQRVEVTAHSIPQWRPPGQFDSYAELNTRRSKILSLEQDKGWIRWPQPMRSDPEKRDKAKFCKFHEGHGHHTEDCITWKDLIEEQVRVGQLGQYLSNPTNFQ